MPLSQLEKARRRLRIAVVVLPLLLVSGWWLTEGQPLAPRLTGAAINIVFTVWFIFLLRRTKSRGNA